MVAQADARLWSGLDARVADNLNEDARTSLRLSLLRELSGLGTPALYERFAKARNADLAQHDATASAQRNGTARYDRFVGEMQAGGWRRLFEEQASLLRLISVITRQWIDTTRELLSQGSMRTFPIIRCDILHSEQVQSRIVARLEGNLSDPHNGGRSVHIVRFADDARIVYKPKDLRLDVAWHALVMRLDGAGAPIELKADTRNCPATATVGPNSSTVPDAPTTSGVEALFPPRRRLAGVIPFICRHRYASREHDRRPPTTQCRSILRRSCKPPPEESKTHETPKGEAFEAAVEERRQLGDDGGLASRNMERSLDNQVFAIGGMTSGSSTPTINVIWNDINSDKMRPVKANRGSEPMPNLPHVDGRYAKFGDHIDDFVAGFEALCEISGARQRQCCAGCAIRQISPDLTVRKIVRPTRFYYMLLQRLRNCQMYGGRGCLWSVQADFLARI